MFFHFFPYQSPSLSLCIVFDAFSSNIDRVLSINPSAFFFFFFFVIGDLNIYHKVWLTYSGKTDRPGEPCHTFSISNNVTRIVNFLTRIPDCNSHSSALSCDPSICSTVAFPPLENPDHVVASVSIDVLQTWCPFWLNRLWLFSCWLKQSFWSCERCSMGRFLQI